MPWMPAHCYCGLWPGGAGLSTPVCSITVLHELHLLDSSHNADRQGLLLHCCCLLAEVYHHLALLHWLPERHWAWLPCTHLRPVWLHHPCAAFLHVANRRSDCGPDQQGPVLLHHGCPLLASLQGLSCSYGHLGCSLQHSGLLWLQASKTCPMFKLSAHRAELHLRKQVWLQRRQRCCQACANPMTLSDATALRSATA